MAACSFDDVGSVAVDLAIVRAIGDLGLGIGAQVELLLPTVRLLADVFDRAERPDVSP